MTQQETIFFYLRVLFLPFLIILTIARAWGSSWSMLEAARTRQNKRFQRMWELMPPDIQDTTHVEHVDEIEDRAIRRFATMLAEYRYLEEAFERVRDDGSKYHYRNTLDQAQRRLRVAETREAAARQALG